MLLLTSTADKIQIVTATTAGIDVHSSFADVDNAGAVTLGRKNTKITTATTTDVVLSPAASTSRNVKSIHVANVHASASNQITIQHTDGTNVVQLESLTLLAGERVSYREGVGMRLIDASGIEKVNAPILSGQYEVSRLAADVSNSTVTPAKITGIDVVAGPGTYLFEYFILYQTSVATTGVRFGVNHTGTVTSIVYDMFGTSGDTTATATQTGAQSQAITATTGGLMEAWSQRAKSTTAPLITSGTDLLTADMLIYINGLMIVTVSGNLELYHASETAAATTVRAGTSLRVTKTA